MHRLPSQARRGPLYVGAVYTNSITINNSGPNTASALFVTNTLPPGVTLVSSSASQGTVGALLNGQVLASLGTVAAGSSANLSLVLAPSFAGVLTNSVTIASGETDLNLANNTAQSVISVVATVPAVLSASISNGIITLDISAQPGFTYVLQGSTNLTSWISLSTNTASAGGTIKFVDTNSVNFGQRYYRSVRLSP